MPKSRLLFLLFCLVAMLLLLPGASRAQIIYSSFGPSQSVATCGVQFYFENPPGFYPTANNQLAAPFTLAGSLLVKQFRLTQIDVPVFGLSYFGAPGEVGQVDPLILELATDAGGTPGTILESWFVSPPGTPDAFDPPIDILSAVDAAHLTLNVGQQYWVILVPIYSGEEDIWYMSPNTGGGPMLTQSITDSFAPAGPWSPEYCILQQETTTQAAFDIQGTPISYVVPPVGVSWNQIIRVIAGPITPAPGAPVEANVSLVDINGNPIVGVTPTTITFNPGQIVSVDFPANAFLKPGQRVEVVPVITPLPNPNSAPPTGSVQVALEIRDALLGIGTVFTSVPTYPPGPSAPSLTSQDLAGGQTMRLIVQAYPPDLCLATLSFADSNSNPLGASQAVNLQPGTATFLDLNADSLGLRVGQTINVQPIVTVTPPIGAAAVPPGSACQATVEVFDHLTLRTETYQTAAVQTPASQ